jgi:hypothetical protein
MDVLDGFDEVVDGDKTWEQQQSRGIKNKDGKAREGRKTVGQRECNIGY